MRLASVAVGGRESLAHLREGCEPGVHLVRVFDIARADARFERVQSREFLADQSRFGRLVDRMERTVKRVERVTRAPESEA